MSGRPCGKVRYDSEGEAERALARIRETQRRAHSRRLVRTSYRCSRCRGWHLTSWAAGDSQDVA